LAANILFANSTLMKIKLLVLTLVRQVVSKETDGDLYLNSQETNVFVACKHSPSPFA